MNIIVLLREDWSVARNLSGHVWHFPSGFLMKEMNTWTILQEQGVAKF